MENTIIGSYLQISKEKPNSMAEVKATVQLQHIQDISPKVYFILETKETYDIFMEHICPCKYVRFNKQYNKKFLLNNFHTPQ